MIKPRKLKSYDQQLDDKLDLEDLAATAGDNYDVYAMNPDTAIPNCPLCKMRMKNHGKYERKYMDYIVDLDGKPRFITLHYLFYKYRCFNEDCERTLYQKPVEFATENANVTRRLESLLTRYAACMSYSQVEQRVYGTVTKQAVGQITKRWVGSKDEERGILFYTPQVLGIISFLWENKSYILVVDAGNKEIPIIEVLKSIGEDEIIVLLNHFNKGIIRYVVTDCNETVVNTVKDQLPGVEILVDTDALLKAALDGFWEIIKSDAKHIMNDDKVRLMKDPRILNDYDANVIRRITGDKPRVSNGYVHINSLRSILSNEWDVSDIQSWDNKIPIDCKNEFQEASGYIEKYWRELLNFYKRRRVVTPELYKKLKKLDEKLREFRNCSDELFRARVLYVCLNGRNIKSRDGKWHGVPYEDVMATMDSLLNEMEE